MDNLVALASNALICLVLLPQLIRLFKKKKARYLSVGLLMLIMPATLCWGVFGYLEHQHMIVAYSLTTAFVNLLTLVLYISRNQFQFQSHMYRTRSHQLLGVRKR